jgi:hypothetical protein
MWYYIVGYAALVAVLMFANYRFWRWLDGPQETRNESTYL